MLLEEVITTTVKSIDLQTLQYLAAVTVAMSASESEAVQYTIGRFRKTIGKNGPYGFLDGQWRQLRGKVGRLLADIGVPNIIVDIILENLWPISFEIFKWILHHVEDTGIDCSSSFCWTPQASIDYKKTAEILVKNEALDIKKRFKLACFYCLGSEVRSLWEQMNLSERRSFFIRGNLRNSNQNPIVLYWSYYIQEVRIGYWRNQALDCTQLLKYAVENGYLCATKYFFRKLQFHLRERMISDCFFIYFRKLNEHDSKMREHLAIACFLVCKQLPDHPGMYFSTKFSLVFLYFLEWPMQKHFMKVVNSLRLYVFAKMYGELLERIFEKDASGFKDHNYKELFMEFWLQMPEEGKIYVNTESNFGFRIFMTFVKKNFGFILEAKSCALKEKLEAIVFQQEISEDATEKDNVEFFKFLVRERVVTKSYINRFIHHRWMNVPLLEVGISCANVPLGELVHLMDGVLESPSQS